MSYKEQGTEQFKKKNFSKAVELLTLAIEETPSDHTLYGNRAACYQNIKEYSNAFKDGEKCVELNPNWLRGHQRKANALHGMGKL